MPTMKKIIVNGENVIYGIPSGGKTAQVLIKKSDEDYDVEWADIESGSVIPSRGYLYGYDINLVDENPDTRVSYPDNVDNYEFNAAKMDFQTDKFSYGDWPHIPGEKFMPKPCMLKFDGTVGYYLNPDNYLQKEDLTLSDINSFDCVGNAMMEWSKIYTKRWESGGVYHFRCSDIKIDDEYECWCNYDIDDKEIDHFYTSIYSGTLDSTGKLRSISKNPPTREKACRDYVNAAKLYDTKIWTLDVVSDYLLVVDLLAMMFKTTNLQSALGYGNCANTVIIDNGTIDDKGLFWGKNSGTDAVKCFGMENYWGNLSRIRLGWNYYNPTNPAMQYVKITRGKKDGTSVIDYNEYSDNTINGYLPISDTAMNAINGRYISGLKTMAYGRFPNVFAGSATTYECDVVQTPSASSTLRNCITGGAYDFGITQVGPYLLNANTSIDSIGYKVGAGLSCKPLSKS